MNDHSPVFDPPSGEYNASYPENIAVGSFIASVTASDMDSGPQGEVYYSIVGGNTGNKFSVNTSSGEVRTIASLDRETTATFTLVIRASDGAIHGKARFSNGTLVVHVTDINDNAPAFADAPSVAVSVSETKSVGEVGATVLATDADSGINSELRYTIISGNDGYFTINSTTGDLIVNRSLDMEQIPLPDLEHHLVINARDLGEVVSFNTSVHVNITIAAINEFTPALQHADNFNFTLAENTSPGDGVVLVDINATDADYGVHGHVTYNLVSGMKIYLEYVLFF